MLSDLGGQCRFARKLWQENAARRAYEAIIRETAPKYSNVQIVDLADQFCGSQMCTAVQGDKVLYGDGSHLNLAGSRLAASVLLKAIDAAFAR